MHPKSILLLGLCVAVIPLAGCSSPPGDEPAAADDPANVAINTPPIHVSQTEVMLKDGQPMVEQTYREALANCSAGSLPVKPLDEEVAKKLGRTFFEIWYQGDQMAVQADRWGFSESGQGAGCEFTPRHDSRLTIDAHGSITVIDLIRRSGTRQPSQGIVRHPVTLDTPDDDKLRAEVAAGLAQAGKGNLMAVSAGESREAGQPCTVVRSAGVEMCVWSGGRAWGFGNTVADDADRMDAAVDYILLKSTPDNGTGHQWSTQAMTVGEAFGDKVFTAPGNGVRFTF